jgi:hypothetical protein
MEPRILAESTVGMHNEDLGTSIERVEKSKMYQDLSTVIICPTRGMFPTRVVQSWMKLMKPINQLVFGPIFAETMNVDDAYNALIKYVLGNPLLAQCKYILTIEEDNLPPPDGLLKLYENMDKYDAIGGLYWQKSEGGFPMLFGDPVDPLDVKPLLPKAGEIQPCNVLGMGFTLFKMDMFRKVKEPWFETVENHHRVDGSSQQTQDFYFMRKAGELGFKMACDNRVLVAHLDVKADKLW